jgi:hypothetical protein
VRSVERCLRFFWVARDRQPVTLYVMPQESTDTRPKANRFWTVLATRAVIAVLLFTVAGLATLAKNGQYYPKSNPVRNVSISTKMNLNHSLVQVAAEPSQPVARFFRPQPPLRAVRLHSPQALQIPRISVVVSMQHRSPPVHIS